MTTLLPGVRAKMGRWTYYMVRMTMKDLTRVKFASEIEEGNALDDTLQRVLKGSRAKTEIATYLQKQPDRFFNSLVIASIGGEPKWFPINIEDDPQLALLAGDENLLGSFGVLRFSDQVNYFALDGQHRLAAIKEMLDPQSPLYNNRPEGFEHEQQSVVLVFPSDAETVPEFKERFRRLFGNLNRYAKPMDEATSIIVDEDDVIAIATRRLFSAHSFFKAVGVERDSVVVDTTSGKNMTQNQPHLTKLEILYSINKTLLDSRVRQTNGWFGSQKKVEEFIRFRPDDSVIEDAYAELSTYWDAILETLPVLKSEAPKMRNHEVANGIEAGDEQDHMLFWPRGQLVLAEVVRHLLDQADVEPGDLASAEKALEPLKKIRWNLDSAPWKHFFIVPNDKGKWIINPNGVGVIRLSISLVIAACSEDGPDEDVWDTLKLSWMNLLLGVVADDDDQESRIDSMWAEARMNLGV